MRNFPLTNAAIAGQIDLLSKLMDLLGENSFKVKSYSIAAQTIKKLGQNLCDLSDQEFNDLKVLGDSVKAKVAELLDKGELAALETLKQKIPEGVLEMMQIKGLGPKKIATLWKELEISSVGELEYACQENRLMTFKGFGKKTQDDILNKIQFLKNSKGFFLWKEIDDVYLELSAKISEYFTNKQFRISGAYARQLPVVHGLDVVLASTEEDVAAFCNDLALAVVAKTNKIWQCATEAGIPILLHLTSAEELDVYDIKLASDPLFWEALQSLGAPTRAVSTAAFFEAMQLPIIPAYLREHTDVAHAATLSNAEDIIKQEHIKGIIHSHSTWSDGVHSLEQMAKAAMEMGLEYLVITDHSKSAFYANGLSVERILQQHQEIDALNATLAPFKIFKGIEADILNDGSLDYEPDVLAQFDVVIASIHSNLNMSEDKAMQRLLTAIQNPYTTMLGHPTGRLLLSRSGYPVNFHALIAACKTHQVAIEVNAHPRRLDIDWTHIAAAQDAGVMLSINPDAHSVSHFDLVKYGVKVAQKAALKTTNNLSSLSLASFEAFLNQRKTAKGLIS